MVVNVEGDNTAVGEIIAEYVGPIPKAETSKYGLKKKKMKYCDND